MEQVNPLPNTVTPESSCCFCTKKPFLVILAIVFVAFLSSLCTYFVMKQQLKNQAPVISPSPVAKTSPAPAVADDTVNWKTYNNKKWEFTFKYPANWEISKLVVESKGRFQTDEELEQADSISIFDPETTKTGLGSVINIGVVFNSQLKPIKCETEIDNKECFNRIFTNVSDRPDYEKKNILGKNAIEITKLTLPGRKFSETLLVYTNNVFSFSFESDIDSFSKTKGVLNQILSTFKFTNTDKTANWKTYKNSVLGFELKYPPTVQVDKELNDQYNRVIIFKGENLHFEVMLRKNPGNITLDKYYFMDSPIKRKTTLAGNSANVYEMPQGYCDGPGCSEPYIAIVTEKGPDLYHLSFFGDIQLSEVENQILSTFKFTANQY